MLKNKLKAGTKVAVYGTLKQGFHNNLLLADSKFLGSERTTAEWRMVSLGGFPALVPGDSTVLVEVFKIESDAVGVSLDRLEGYPSFYDRRLIPTSHGEAWIYFMRDADKFGVERDVENGEW